MNARQKAKKYKRMYEELLKQPVRFKVEQHKIDTVRFERLYPEALIEQGDTSYLREFLDKDIAEGIASSIGKCEYVDLRTEFCPHINKYRIYGEIKVVARLNGESEEI